MFHAAKNCPPPFDLVGVIRARNVHPCYLVSKLEIRNLKQFKIIIHLKTAKELSTNY